MLKPMPGTPGLRGTEAEQTGSLEIIVEGLDIGIDMMQPIMLVAPEPLAPADHIEHAAHEPVEGCAVGVAPVCPIMHEVETHQRTPLRQRKHHEYGHEEGRGTKD